MKGKTTKLWRLDKRLNEDYKYQRSIVTEDTGRSLTGLMVAHTLQTCALKKVDRG